MSNPINRIIILSIVLYFSLIFGNVYLLSTLMEILKKNKLSNIIWNSALFELLFIYNNDNFFIYNSIIFQ